MSDSPRKCSKVVLLACLAMMVLAPSIAHANAVDDWSAIGNQVIIVNANRSGTGNIDFAYMYIAIYDAVNAIDQGHTVFAVSRPVRLRARRQRQPLPPLPTRC